MLEQAFLWLPAAQAYISCKHDGDKILAFDRASLVFVFNFHPTKSFDGYRVSVPEAGAYRIVLDSDRGEYGGHDILCKEGDKLKHDSYQFTFNAEAIPHNGYVAATSSSSSLTDSCWRICRRPFSFLVYTPSRTALVFAPVARIPADAPKLPCSLAAHHPLRAYQALHS